MTKRIPRSQWKRFTIEVTRDHWRRAKLMCRHDTVTKTLPDGSKVKSEGTGSNCVIADALVEFLGSDAPTIERQSYDYKSNKYVTRKFINVGVGESIATIGRKSNGKLAQYRHNGSKLVEAFDSDLKLAQALKEYEISLPMKVTFIRQGN